MTDRRTPLVIETDATPLPHAPPPAEAPPPPDANAPSAAEKALRAAQSRPGGSAVTRLFWWALGGLIVLIAGLSIERFVSELFARYEWLGWIGSGLLGIVALGLLAFVLRELSALSRLSRIDNLHDRARAAAEGDGAALDIVLSELQRLYSARAGARQEIASVRNAAADTPDPEARLELIERLLIADLDREAEHAVTRAAQEVAAATALIPLTLVDVLAVLAINLRMIRRIAQIYGGRSGYLGSLRLLRAVATHLVATGAVAATDELLGPMVGGGILGKLSRKFGEAAVNAALTARVGVSAIEVCRPLPFVARSRPKARSIVLGALKDWRLDQAPD